MLRTFLRMTLYIFEVMGKKTPYFKQGSSTGQTQAFYHNNLRIECAGLAVKRDNLYNAL